MPKSNVTATLIAEVCARLLKRESQGSIKRRTGLSMPTIRQVLTTLQENDVEVMPLPQSSAAHASKEKAFELFRTTELSNRQIVGRAGISLNTINKWRREYNLDLVNAGNDLPRCKCGQYLHHPRSCWARLHKNMAGQGVASVRTLPLATQGDIRSRLLRGETMRSIAESVGLKRAHIQSFLQSFTADERSERMRAFNTGFGRGRAARIAKRVKRPSAFSPRHDPLYAQILALIPRNTDPALRDDMVSQAYLDVLEGRIQVEHLAEGVRKIRSSTFKAFANRWGDLSLDAPIGSDGAQTLADVIPAGRSLFA